ncbi:MAG: O-antigen ligase family protein [Candidatus Melainabacteria bacterium]|nr:O-antigen ligase family protein [Candidatus Melainabacteria bacterium]
MTKLQAFYQRTAKLEEFVILAYAVAVFLPITYAWIFLIVGLVLYAARAIIEIVLLKRGEEIASSGNGEACLESKVAETSTGSGAGSSGGPSARPSTETSTSGIESGGTQLGTGHGTESVAVPVNQSTGKPICSIPALTSINLAPLAIPLLVFAIAVFISGIFNGGIKEGFSSMSTLRTFLVYFVAYHAFRTSPQLISKTVVVLLSFGAIAGIWGSIQQIFHYHPFDYPWLQASGFMGMPMAYAGQMAVTACLSLALVFTGGFKSVFKNAPLFYMIAACNLAGVFFASERSAWLGMLVATLVIAWMVSLKTFMRGFLVLILAGAIAWFTVPVVQTRIVPIINNPKADVGVQARFVIWEKSIEVWKQHPVVGVGARNFPKFDIPEAIVPGKSTMLVHAHSNIFQILTTMGVIGLLAFVYLELSSLFVAFKNWRSPLNDAFYSAVALGIFGGVVSLMVAGFFEYNFGTGHVRLLHWFVLAMLMSHVSLRPAKALEPPGGK